MKELLKAQRFHRAHVDAMKALKDSYRSSLVPTDFTEELEAKAKVWRFFWEKRKKTKHPTFYKENTVKAHYVVFQNPITHISNILCVHYKIAWKKKRKKYTQLPSKVNLSGYKAALSVTRLTLECFVELNPLTIRRSSTTFRTIRKAS